MEPGMSTNVFRFVQRKATSLDPNRFQASAGSFVNQLRPNDSATLLVMKTDGVINQMMVVDSKAAPDQVGLSLAQALNAHMERTELPDLLDFTEAVVKVRVDPARIGRDNQHTSDLLALAGSLAEMIPDDAWVAVSVRQPSKHEARSHMKWLSYRMNTPSPVHHSIRKGAVVVSITAGGRHEHLIDSLASFFVGALPGFDLQTISQVASGNSKLRWGLAAAALTGAGTFIGMPLLPAETFAALPEGITTFGTVATVAAGAAGVFGFTPVAPNERATLLKQLGRGFQAPRKRASSPRAPRQAGTKMVKRKLADGTTTSDIVQVPAFEGDYPLNPESFMMDPSLFAAMVSPHATATTGESVEKERQLPPALTEANGPRIGTHATGAPVYFDATSIQHGVSIFGTPGAGKSVLTRSLFAWCCLEKRSPSGRPGAPGVRNTMIAFENKGRGGADMYLKWGEATGVPVVLVDLMNPKTPAIDFFDQTRGPEEVAKSFVSAMTYAWGEDSIGAQAGPVLTQILIASQAVDAPVIDSHNANGPAAEMPHNMSPVYYAWRLLGGRNMKDAAELFTAIRAKYTESGNSDPRYKLAIEHAGHLFDATESQRRSLTTSSKNKMDALKELEPWWTPQRPRKTWAKVLTDHDTIVLNMGPSAEAVMAMDDRATPIISAMLTATLRESISTTCDDWAAQNRWVSVFADELSLIAGSSGEVLEWIRSKGRAFGLRPTFATQYPEQLPTQLRDSLMDYSTFVSFRQGNRNTAAAIAHQITTSSSEWSDEDLTLMPDYHLVVRTQSGGRRQDATMLANDFFEDRMDEFAHHQGYPETDTGTGRRMVDPVHRPLVETHEGQLAERDVQL